VTVEVRWAEAARAADASQAAYFREALAGERRTVTQDLVHARHRLRACVDREEVVGLRGMARARFAARDLENRLREIDRMIGALDRRFAAMWSADG
jgi:hypothetical protein